MADMDFCDLLRPTTFNPFPTPAVHNLVHPIDSMLDIALMALIGGARPPASAAAT